MYEHQHLVHISIKLLTWYLPASDTSDNPALRESSSPREEDQQASIRQPLLA
jgi:hypothetical protein